MSGYTDSAKLESNRNCLRRIARHDELQFSKDSIVNVMEKFVKTVNVMDETILVPCRLMDHQVGDSDDFMPAHGKDSTANQLMLTSNAHGKRSTTNSKNVHEFLNSSELFNLYSMLNSLKNDLLWTGKDETGDEDHGDYGSGAAENLNSADFIYGSSTKTESLSTETLLTTQQQQQIGNSNNNNSSSSTIVASGSTSCGKGHNRRPSTASVASTASVSNMSDAESDISNENDSGVESEGNKSDNNLQSSDGSISSSEEAVAHQKKKAANQDKATELARRCRRHLNGLYQCLEQMTEAANYLTARYQSDIGPV